MQLRVIKADGSIEEYLHTKVVGTINNALVLGGEPNMFVAERLAEAITYFLYSEQQRHKVTSSEIFSMVQVALAVTSYENAAEALNEYQCRRQIGRRRLEVIETNAEADAMIEGPAFPQQVTRWEKSRIVSNLVTKRRLDRQTARAVASMVEEKVLKMGASRVSAALIKQLVLADTAAMLHAQQQLQAALEDNRFERKSADTDIRLRGRDVAASAESLRFRQQQEGLCTVGL